MMPAYRDGDVILVSPAAPIRRGDRVVVKTKDGEGDGEAARKTAKKSPSTAFAQSRTPRAHACDVGCAVGGESCVGEPVAS
jgi:SOS-response transcriptional repressor LexA